MGDDRIRTILADLGRANLRGIRKCPKCGTFNGSRCPCCKNKQCDAIFPEVADRRRKTAEACKIITGTSVQLFSLKLRDKVPEHRGFVQLPHTELSVPTTAQIASSSAAAASSSALCFVDKCEWGFNNGLQLHYPKNDVGRSPTNYCHHIEAALQCYAEAQPLTLRNSVLSSLNVNNDIKQEIWLLATESSGPLVQRVSKTIMAVKCKPSPKHPLGYLHFSFSINKLKDQTEYKFSCSCSSFGVSNEEKAAVDSIRCVHFYACICAFASDPKLAEEFQYFINIDQHNLNPDDSLDFEFNTSEVEKFVGVDLDSLTNDTNLLMFRDSAMTPQSLTNERMDIKLDDIQLDPSILSDNIEDTLKESEQNLLDDSVISEIQNLEAMNQNAAYDRNGVKIIQDTMLVDKFNIAVNNFPMLDNCIRTTNGTAIKILNHNLILDPNSIKIININSVPINPVVPKKPVERKTSNSGKRKREDKNLSSITNINSIEPRKNRMKLLQAAKKYLNTCENVDESTTNLSFVKWLSSVTERINQTMHFQFDGKPEPLVFHVPQPFFECLRERMSCGAKKKRLPNSTTAFVRRDAVPLGIFTKYTWHITNILHVKSIFETQLVPLEITRSFMQKVDGSYELYKREEEEIDRFKKTSNNPLIKPLELKTFLKVGNTSPDQEQPTPFLIEWIPDILPVSKIGELRIKFEFGHVKNESPQRWKKVALSKTK